MKLLFFTIILFAFTFSAFSQAANIQRYRALGDAIGLTLERGNAALEDFNSRVRDDGTTLRYTRFLRQHRDLANALHDSEWRLNFLLRGSAHRTLITEEHANFEDLIRQLDALKTEYDNWLRTVQ